MNKLKYALRTLSCLGVLMAGLACSSTSVPSDDSNYPNDTAAEVSGEEFAFDSDDETAGDKVVDPIVSDDDFASPEGMEIDAENIFLKN